LAWTIRAGCWKVLVEGDNLRLMQSMLGPACILMGGTKEADPGDSTQGSAKGQAGEASTPGKAPTKSLPRRKSQLSGK
jgi:hypothetical protein